MRTGAIRTIEHSWGESSGPLAESAIAAFTITQAGAVVDGDLTCLARLQSLGVFQQRFRRLTPSDPADAAHFGEACRLTARTARERGAPHALSITLGGPERGEARIHLIAAPVLPGREILLMATVDPVFPTEAAFPDKADRLRRRFGLTSAEAEIAVALAAGASPVQLADQRASSVQTVRSQIKAAYAKLGVGRVAELCARVSAL